MRRPRIGVGVAAAVALLLPASLMHPAEAQSRTRMDVVTDKLDGPRGVDNVGRRLTVVSEADGTVSLVRERRMGRPGKVRQITAVPSTGVAPAVDVGRDGTVWILTGGAPGTPGDATLYRWRGDRKNPKAVKNIGRYQAKKDPDPFDLEDNPGESNPFGVAALRDGSVLVADAAGNDLLRVWKKGKTRTVARLMPRTVEVPEELPDTDPDGNPLPPAGTPIPAEGVATSVTVGRDGYWYVGELRGFPATPGTSQIWRIRPGSVGATCNPERPNRGKCQRFADGLTSIVDLDRSGRGVLAVSLSKVSWLQAELGAPGSEIGGVYNVRRDGRSRDLGRNRLVLPGGVDAGKRGIYVTTPILGFAGPGRLVRLH